MVIAAIQQPSQTSDTTMASIQLPPTQFQGDGSLRIVLLPSEDDDNYTNAGSDYDYSEFDYLEPPTPQPPKNDDPNIPKHPITNMQDAFAESLHEVTIGGVTQKPKLKQLDAKGRREKLLGQAGDEEPFDVVWRYRPGQEQHEMYKLVAQIIFGVYLLVNGMANDNTQVVTILQGHINEVDEFLEVMLEDFAQAHEDLAERIAHLQLPMANRRAFEEMLSDRTFRLQILEGNQKIDHILTRTNAAMRQWDDDIDSGLRSSGAFADWLVEQKNASWRVQPELSDIYEAMKGNVDGWLNAFDTLNSQAQDLNGLIIKLMTIVAEMEKTAGEVSRRTWASIPPFSLPIHHPPRQDDLLSPTSPCEEMLLLPRTTYSTTPRAVSEHSGDSASTLQPSKKRDSADDNLIDFPLPGGTPLLPPRALDRSKKSTSNVSTMLPIQMPPSPPHTEKKADSDDEERQDNTEEDAPLFLLQPRTYTPQPPAPLPSPMVRNDEPQAAAPWPVELPQHTDYNKGRNSDLALRESHNWDVNRPSSISQPGEQDSAFSQKRTSLRQRLSLKRELPESIRIPPRANTDTQQQYQSPQHLQPVRPATSHQRDTSVQTDVSLTHQLPIPRSSSHLDLTAPMIQPQLLHSPRSDCQQFYHPVRASPYSPLQQRPHTAVPAEAQHRPSTYHGHQRNLPSRAGGMSTLSNVTMAAHDERGITPSNASSIGSQSGRRLKKKKSAFGWLRKAFTLDDDEKAAFEARKAAAQRDMYYEGHSPKFLDGKRLR